MEIMPAQMRRGRTGHVIKTIEERIAGRSLVAGAKLPSVRSLARTLGVSVSTVVEAYSRLTADGAILSRPGSGFFVAPQLTPLALAEASPKLDRTIDPLWISRQALAANEITAKPGCGWLPQAWLPTHVISKAMRSIARAGAAELAEYSVPLGLLPLRQLISRKLGEKGVEAAPNQIVLTDSGTQAIDMLCRLLIEPGDTVVVDDPCYFNFQALLKAQRVRMVSVPYTPEGPDVDLFAQTVAQHRPRLYITNSGVHNPTGATLAPAVAHRVLRIVREQGMIVVEDDIFSDFEHVPAPRLAGLDGLDRVVQIGSFSKSLSASVRCGFIATRADWIDNLVDLKIATTFGGARLNEAVVHAALRDGGYARHLRAMRDKLDGVRSEVSLALSRLGLRPWLEPRAGMFIWARLPEDVDAVALARAALERNMVLAPGNAFSVAQTAGQFMRFNVAQIDAASLGILADLVKSSRGDASGREAVLR